MRGVGQQRVVRPGSLCRREFAAPVEDARCARATVVRAVPDLVLVGVAVDGMRRWATYSSGCDGLDDWLGDGERDFDSVSPVPLGTVERLVGGPHQMFRCQSVVRKRCNANRNRRAAK